MHRILLLLSKMTPVPAGKPGAYRSEAERRAEKAANVALVFVFGFIVAAVLQIVVTLYYETHHDVGQSASFGNLKYTTGVTLLMLGQAVILYAQKRSDAYAHKATHEMNETNGALSLNAQDAALTAQRAVEEARAAARLAVEKAEKTAKEAVAEIRRQLEPLVNATNGNLRENLDRVFEQALTAYKTLPAEPHPECKGIAIDAARMAVAENMEKLRAAGWQPPPQAPGPPPVNG
jgi:uncharacterized protein YceH (UPF0502 family)